MASVIDMPGIKIFGGTEQERVQKFMEGVERLGQQYDCALIPEIRIVGTNIVPNIVAVAKPRLPEGEIDPSVN